ncbi:hypothetical protein PO909_010299 [Leuciscus waleckii]
MFELVFLRKCLNMIVSYGLLPSLSLSLSLSRPLAVQNRGTDRIDVCGQICNKKDLESCNGPNGYSVSVSD